MARRSFKRHMTSAFLQLVVLPMAVLGLLILISYLFNAQSQARTRLSDQAATVQVRLDQHLVQHQQALALLAYALESGPLDEPARDLNGWLNAMVERYPGVLTMLVANRQGRIIAGSPESLTRTIVAQQARIDDRAYFTVPMRDGGSFISDAFQGRGFGTDPIVAISHRLMDERSQPFGIVQLSLNLQVIADLIQHIGSLPGTELVIVDSRNRVVAASVTDRYPFLSHLPGDWAVAPPSACRLALSRGCFTLSLPLTPVQWQVLIRQSPLEAYRPLGLFLLFTGAALGVALLVALLEGQRLARGIAEPLTDLAASVGDSDFDHPLELPQVPGASPREVAVLNEAFERLKERLDGYNARLDAQMRKLEAQVQHRTHELERSRTELFQFLEGAPALIMSINEVGAVAYGNRQFRDSLGYDAAELTGMSLSDLVVEEAGTTAVREVLALQPGQSVADLEWCFRSQSGRRMRLSGSALCTLDAQGEFVSRVVLRDVTALHEAEQALRHKSELLDLFVRHAPAAVAMFDDKMRCLAVSERWLKDYGLSEADMLGERLYDVFPNLPDSWRALHQKCLKGEVVTRDEDPYRHADGRMDWLRWEARPWRGPLGEVGGLIIQVDVVTKDKLLRDRLREHSERDRVTGLLTARSLARRMTERDDDGSALALIQIRPQELPAIPAATWQPAVARRLETLTRQCDLLARVSGDTFAVLIDDPEPDAVLARIAKRLRAPMDIEDQPWQAEISVRGPATGTDAREWLSAMSEPDQSEPAS